MKKLNYLVLPLLVVPFLASCGCSKAKCEKVTEQEFNDATSIKGVEYLQVHQNVTLTQTYGGETKSQTMNSTRLMSPGVYHRIDEITEEGEEDGYKEIYSTGNAEACDYIERDSKKGSFSESKHLIKDDEDYEEYFTVPQYFSVPLYGLTFQDFTYTNDGYVYSGDKPGYSIDMSIYFAKKKVTKLIMNNKITAESYSSTSEGTVEYTYNETVPADPSK